MTIDVYSHNTLHHLVDIERFTNELKKEIKYDKFKQNVKVFFINSPRIKGMVETDIDLLLIIAIENKEKSFYSLQNYSSTDQVIKPKSIYFNNLIIPIKFIDYLNNLQAPEVEGSLNYLYTDEYEENIGDYRKEMFRQTKNYLEAIWKDHQLKLSYQGEPIKFNITPHPIIWVLSPSEEYRDFSRPNFIYAPRFGFNELTYYLRSIPYSKNSFTSNAHWSIDKNNHEAFMIIDQHIEILKEKLEKDNKIGSLTKQKIDRLNKQYAEDLKIYEKYLDEQNENNSHQDDENIFDLIFSEEYKKQKRVTLPDRIRADKELNKNLVIISGKAGSGKTFEMLSLIKKSYENAKNKAFSGGKSGYYLTYNKLLAHDVRLITNQYQSGTKTSIQNLHKFFRDRTKSLQILWTMTNNRILELSAIQDQRKTRINEYLLNNPNTNIPSDEWDKGTTEFFLRWKNHNKNYNLDEYTKINKKKIANKLSNNVFLEDYYQVLRYFIQAIKDPKKLFYQLEMDKISEEQWSAQIKENKGTTKYKLTPEDFTKLVNRSLGAIRGQGKILFIDEGQDCHPLERDIFLLLWEKKNIVVCTGGREQLIRHNEECNWKYSDTEQKVIHNVIEIKKRNRTFRMKQNIVELCNFIANEFQMNLDLSAIRSNDDKGSIIIEMNDPYHHKLQSVVNKLQQAGEYNALSNYESILFLTESESELLFKKGKLVQDIQIDENNNIIYSESKKSKQSTLTELTGIPEDQFFTHNHIMYRDDKEQNTGEEEKRDEDEDQVPTSDTYRSLFYESCRGLEAWSVVCLELDLFYERKKREETAASYLSDDLYLSEDERRQKYAATWVLMALTRPIDTLYIQINDPNSELGVILAKYLAQA